MYLDGKGFDWKQNLKDQVLAPKGRIWRRKGEGLEPGCTTRAGKAGTTNLNFMISISHSKRVILCERYYGTIIGDKFSNVFSRIFFGIEKSVNLKAKKIVQDNCPRQNSAVAKKVLWAINV